MATCKSTARSRIRCPHCGRPSTVQRIEEVAERHRLSVSTAWVAWVSWGCPVVEEPSRADPCDLSPILGPAELELIRAKYDRGCE